MSYSENAAMAGDIFVGMRIGVDAALSMDAALQVREEVGRVIILKIQSVRDVVVHLETKDHCKLQKDAN